MKVTETLFEGRETCAMMCNVECTKGQQIDFHYSVNLLQLRKVT